MGDGATTHAHARRGPEGGGEFLILRARRESHGAGIAVSEAEINRALQVLRVQPAAVSNVELARLCGTTTASASRWTTRLVAEGLATREKAGRCVAIGLTAKGRRA